jgi:c-di-GMP-binding flagellar brake protein YcgR
LGQKISISDSSLVGSHAVIEGKNYIAMGKVSFIEGEIFEVEFPQYKNFYPGDAVKIIIYSSGSRLRFETAVIAQDTGTIIMLTPHKMLEKFLQRREHPRISVDIPGLIYSVTDVSLNQTDNLPDPCKIAIDNISLNGIGFSAEGLEFKEKTIIFTELKFEHPILCPIQIIHKKQIDQGMHFGGKFIDLKQVQLNSIRALILKHQIEIYCEHKKNEFLKEHTISTDIEEVPLHGQRKAKV